MITFPCDRCERPLEFDDAQAGQKVECPHCGDVNVVRARAAVSKPGPSAKPPAGKSAADRAAAKGLPPDSGPEQRVAMVRPAMFRASPFVFAGLCLVASGGIVGGTVLLLTAALAVWGVLALVAGVAALGWLGVWKVKTLGAGLEITNKRTIEVRGLLSRSTSEVMHDNIRNVRLTQTFWNRLCGVGRIEISSSGQDDLEIRMDGVPRPRRILEIIDAYRPM